MCFNTQPPEGGWALNIIIFDAYIMFQHTAARRRLGPLLLMSFHNSAYRFNTQPPEGGWLEQIKNAPRIAKVSTHSRLKAAGESIALSLVTIGMFQHTAA